MKAQTLVDSLSELMVDASLGTIQCLEEIVSNTNMHNFCVMVSYRLVVYCILDLNNCFKIKKKLHTGSCNQTGFWWFLQVQEFFGSSSNLQSTVVQVLWERFTGKRETSVLHRRAAVLLLGMAAR